MGSIKLKVHPLFYLWLLFEIAVGNVFVFFVYTLTAIIHEIGHSFSAYKRGYALDKLTLTPFGAVVSGDADFDLLDQVVIAFSGPMINFLIGLFLVSLWWCFPETYAYTDVVATANFSMAIVNLLPCYPLDGGRILFSLLARKVKEETARFILVALGVIIGVVGIVVFFLTVKSTPNASLLLFSLFMIIGALSVKKENRYVRLYTGVNQKKLKRGMPYNRIAIDESASVKTLAYSLNLSAVNEVVVFKNGEIKKVLDQNSITKILENAVYREKISKYI